MPLRLPRSLPRTQYSTFGIPTKVLFAKLEEKKEFKSDSISIPEAAPPRGFTRDLLRITLNVGISLETQISETKQTIKQPVNAELLLQDQLFWTQAIDQEYLEQIQKIGPEEKEFFGPKYWTIAAIDTEFIRKVQVWPGANLKLQFSGLSTVNGEIFPLVNLFNQEATLEESTTGFIHKPLSRSLITYNQRPIM